MIIEHEILINQYGQDILSLEELMKTSFLNLNTEYQRMYLNDVVNLIIQSKPKYEDVSLAIAMSQLKETYTPCVLLRKGISYVILSQIANLPNNEWEKSAKLLLSLFKIAYKRRFLQETQTTHKWWYKDLSGTIDKSRNVSKANPFYLLTQKLLNNTEHILHYSNLYVYLQLLQIYTDMKSIFRSVWNLYADGFRNMTWGRTLWWLILLKVVILFLVLRLFFFQPVLSGKTDEQKMEHVGRELMR